jgi:hypothetical protein
MTLERRLTKLETQAGLGHPYAGWTDAALEAEAQRLWAALSPDERAEVSETLRRKGITLDATRVGDGPTPPGG